MSKQELKQSIREAIEQSSFRGDIRHVALFGSQSKGDQTNESDVDLLIEFSPNARIGFFKFFGIRNDIEQHIHKKIDLVTKESLSKYFRDEVILHSETIYEK